MLSIDLNHRGLNGLLGLGLGLATLAGALTLAQIPWQTLINPAGLLVVIGGTLTATWVGSSLKAIGGCWQACAHLLWGPGSTPNQNALLAEDLFALAVYARSKGLLALKETITQIETSEPFLAKGLGLLMDNTPLPLLQDTLTTELELLYRHDLEQARLLEAAGGYAPTMGLMGALVGLMHTVQGLGGAIASANGLNSTLGAGVASAFSSTLLGLAVANLWLLPLAASLRQHARGQFLRKTMMLEALRAMAENQHPLRLQEKLRAFLLQGFGAVTTPSSPMGSPATTPAPAAAIAEQRPYSIDLHQQPAYSLHTTTKHGLNSAPIAALDELFGPEPTAHH